MFIICHRGAVNLYESPDLVSHLVVNMMGSFIMVIKICVYIDGANFFGCLNNFNKFDEKNKRKITKSVVRRYFFKEID